MNLFKSLFAKKKVINEKTNEGVLNDFLQTCFENYSINDPSVAILKGKKSETGKSIHVPDAWLTVYCNETPQEVLHTYKTIPIVESIQSQMLDIGSSTMGGTRISDATISLYVHAHTDILSKYATASLIATMAANCLCSIFYVGDCKEYELSQVYKYLDSKGYNPVQVLAYCYYQYKLSMSPVYIGDYYKYLFMESEPGAYNLDLKEILDRVENVSADLKLRYVTLLNHFSIIDGGLVELTSLTVNGRYTNYKGNVNKLYADTKNELYNWENVELMIFMTAHNYRLPTPLAFTKNALQNDLVAMYLYNYRKLVNQQK